MSIVVASCSMDFPAFIASDSEAIQTKPGPLFPRLYCFASLEMTGLGRFTFRISCAGERRR